MTPVIERRAILRYLRPMGSARVVVDPVPIWANPDTPDVYIIGALNRSGTTFLADALAATGDLQRSPWGFEDYLHVRSSHLVEYVQRTLELWRHNRPDLPAAALERRAHDLAFSLGDAISSAQRTALEPRSTRLILKTPQPAGIESFFQLHRRALLLIVVRDGRDTVESGRRSWSSWSIEAGARAWAANVRTILRFLGALDRAERRRCLLVHYEKVARGSKAALARVFRFARVPAARIPWTKIQSLPLRGSSTDRGDRASLHWDPVPKPRDFNPVGRWHGWTAGEKRAFKKLAGRELIALGYADDLRW